MLKKIPGNLRHHSLLAILLAAASITIAVNLRDSVQASDTLTTTDSTTLVTICTYKTGDWSVCDSSGYQTRTVTKTPDGCQVDSSVPVPATKQTCTYAPPSCSYTYSDWSVCTSTGYQTRTVISQTPSGCVATTAPETKRTCTYTITTTDNTTATIACSYTYSAWSDCNSSGYQARTIATKSPSGCVDSATPILKQSCAYSTTDTASSTACAYNLTDWSACDTSGYQSRSIISKTPSGCYVSEQPELKRQCDAAATSSSTAAVTSLNPPFNFLNLNGGEVISGKIAIQGTVSNAKRVELYLIPAESNIPKYLGQAKLVSSNTWEYALDSTGQPNGSFYLRTKITNAYGTYDSPGRRLIILNPAAEVSAPDKTTGSEERTAARDIPSISAEWEERYFKRSTCIDQSVCGGDADPDMDGLNNNEEYRYGTDPTNPDTDQDGFLDGDEIKNGFNPLKAAPGDKSDKMVFQSPKDDTGEVKKDVYKVEQVELVAADNGSKNIRLSGKALPNTYVTLYIYSDPIVLTVKTDDDGNWSYLLDKNLEDGSHEVYVAVTDNTGQITAKSEPLAFIKTAEAATIIPPAEASAGARSASPADNYLNQGFSLFISIALGALALTVAALGLVKHELARKGSSE